MNRMMVAQELVKVAELLTASRPSDSTGSPIVRTGEYSLRNKRSGKWFAGGSWSAWKDSSKADDAQVFMGDKLLNLAYDWTMNWDAIKFKD